MSSDILAILASLSAALGDCARLPNPIPFLPNIMQQVNVDKCKAEKQINLPIHSMATALFCALFGYSQQTESL